MTTLTLPALVVTALAFWRPAWWPLSLALAGVAPAGVALIVGGLGIPVFYFVAMFAAASVGLRLASVTTGPPVRIRDVPGGRALMAFGIWAAVVTVTAPALFPGMTVLGSSPTTQTMLVPGTVTSSNIAQVAYLWIALAVILLVASVERTHGCLVGVTVIAIVALSFWKYLSDLAGLPFPAGLFDNNPGWIYIQTAPGGAERFRGILSEPASLATYCLAAAAFAVAMLPRVATVAKVGLLVVLGASVWMGVASTSTTFVVAGSILCALALLAFAWPLFRRRKRLSPTHVVVALVLLILGYVVGPALSHYVTDVVMAKSGSDSYSARSGLDAFSLQVAFRSMGFGVGLGANRPSSFALMLLSNVGVVGFLLFVAAVVLIVRHALTCGGAAPTVWVLVAILTAKLVSGPDLSDPSGLLYVSLGALAGLSTRQRPPSLPPPSDRAAERRLSFA